MTDATIHDIHISVETFYQPQHARPQRGEHFFAYRITIENRGAYAVQLMRRHWYITDADGERREVEGEGVVGEQPVIEPGEGHQYVSGCGFVTEIGKMEGIYLMRRVADGREFEVDIPPFVMVYPPRLN